MDEIAALLRLSSADCEDVQSLARSKLALVCGKIDIRGVKRDFSSF
ncbi:MAG TPA: hypothetical protein VMP00_15260 [Burkholderiales bacterium]|nr:hypothetical protein [Burkholderiales bacterium]